MPDRPAKPWSVIVAALLMGVVSAVVVGMQPWAWVSVIWDLQGPPEELWTQTLTAPDVTIDLAVRSFFATALALFAVLAVLVALLGRSPLAHRLLNWAFYAQYGLILVLVVTARRLIGLYVGFEVEANGDDMANLNQLVLDNLLGWVWPLGVYGLICLIVQILVNRAPTYRAYGRQWEGALAPGDRFLESIRSCGIDPRYRKAMYGSVGLHLLIVILSAVGIVGCIRPYILPPGSGTPATPEVVAKKVEKKKEVMILAEESPIIFEKPEITDSQVVENIQKESEKEYTTTAAGTPGALGEGGGTEGGWPDGLPGGELRFIRLQYAGAGWDDGLTAAKGNADANFLARLRKLPSIKFPVAARGEFNTISQLPQYPKGFAPPFVFMTGEGDIRMSNRDVEILRNFLYEGSLLFADAGSPSWDKAFRSLLRRLFPGKPLVRIPDDDIIFKAPYVFPNGIAPLFSHGGRHAMGIKHKGRWVVFYHPGDVNDPWKDNAVRIDKHIRDNAFQTGQNVIYYAITQYLQATRKYRKR